MKMRLPGQSLRAFGYIFLALIAFGCNSQNVDGVATSNAPTSGGGGSGSNGGIACGSNDFCINVAAPSGATMILHEDGSYTTPCAVAPGANTEAAANISCILDAGQMDLYQGGTQQSFGLTYNVPAGMCSYFVVDPYFYYQYQPGIGPASVVEEKAANGTVTYYAALPTDFGAAPTYTFDGTFTYGTPSTSNADQTAVGVDPNTGACTTNYGGNLNCCSGNYTLTVIDMTASPATVTSTPNQSWGGNPYSCLVGPGVDFAASQNHLNGGYPDATSWALAGSNLDGTLTVNAPISKGFGSNAFVANYFQSGITGSYPFASAPNAVQGPAGFLSGNPWYEFDCLDGEENYIARIRVMVRSWTYNQNFDWFVNNQEIVDAANDPNSFYNIWGVQNLFPDEPYLFRETWVTPYEFTGAGGTFGPGNLTDPGTTGAVNTEPCPPGADPTDPQCGFGSAYPGAFN